MPFFYFLNNDNNFSLFFFAIYLIFENKIKNRKNLKNDDPILQGRIEVIHVGVNAQAVHPIPIGLLLACLLRHLRDLG